MRSSFPRAIAVLAFLGAAILFAVGSPGRGGATEEERAPTPDEQVLVVSVRGEINRVQAAYLRRVLGGADREFHAVIFELHTPGGRLDVMSMMSEEIRRLNVPTVTFVNTWAISAGAYIAMSSDRIYMAPTGVIGGARAILIGPEGPIELPEDVAEKFASVNRAQFRALAEEKGYPPAIAEAMTDESIEVLKVEYEGEIRYMTGSEVTAIVDDPEQDDRIRIIDTVSAAGQLVTLTAKEAVEYDVATKAVSDLDAVLAENDWADKVAVRREQQLSDKVVGFLTSRPIVSLLVLIGFAGIWLEMRMPGFGIPGTVAVMAFVLVFGSQFLLGNAHAAEILLFLVGLTLIGIELFVIPDFGVIGAAGIICVILSLVLAMQRFVVPSWPWEAEALRMNLLTALAGMGTSILVLILVMWLVPGRSIFDRLTLKTEMKTELGFGTQVVGGKGIEGREGRVITGLRPAGTMQIGDERYSVVTDGEFVPPGGRARVIRVEGTRVVVEPVDEEGQTADEPENLEP